MTLPTEVEVVNSEVVWEHLRDPERSRAFDHLVFGQQGGELVDLVAVEGTWPARAYTIQLRSVRGELFPTARGCFSAVQGQGDNVFPLFAATVLRFSLPRAPIGVYDIELVGLAPNEADDDLHLTLPKRIRLAPAATSLEVNRYRTFFNPEVYSKRGPLT